MKYLSITRQSNDKACVLVYMKINYLLAMTLCNPDQYLQDISARCKTFETMLVDAGMEFKVNNILHSCYAKA